MKRLWAPLASLVPGSWYTLGLLLIILLHFRRKTLKLFTGKYIVFKSRNGTGITSVGITWMICLMRARRNVPEISAATARHASWDESGDNGEEKDDTESRRKEKEGNLGHGSGQ